MLFVLNSLEMHVMFIYMFRSGIARPVGGWGHYKLVLELSEVYVWVAFPDLLVAGDVTNWYQSHGFNTEPGWAMLVEVEAKFSEKNCCQNGQNSSSEPWVQTLNLDGPDKWSLELEVEIMSHRADNK
jgi:hypothetical protein